MTREEVLNKLEELVNLLQSMDLKGEELLKKDRLVENISQISRIIVNNALKEGTKALENSTKRLISITELLEKDKENVEKTAGNLNKVLGVLGAIASVIRFI